MQIELPICARTIFTSAGISPRISASTRACCASSMQIGLVENHQIGRRPTGLRTTRAAAIRDRDSDRRVRCASTACGFAANWPLAAAGPSTTVTTASTVNAFLIGRPVERLHERLGQREARTFRSARDRSARAARRVAPSPDRTLPARCSTGIRSPVHTDCARPYDASSSQPMPQPLRISPSMPSSPNSLTITAMRRPFAC